MFDKAKIDKQYFVYAVKHKLIEILSGYTTSDKSSSGKKFRVKTVTGSANTVSLTRFGKRVAQFFSKLTKVVSYTPSRTYGALFCIFGALSLMLHFIKDYVGVYDNVPVHVLIISSIFTLLSIPFMVSDKPLSIALQPAK